jgi:hypothetical protein
MTQTTAPADVQPPGPALRKPARDHDAVRAKACLLIPLGAD